MLRKIVSGGQTGVDRGALDAALETGFPCGGWCPEGRRAEDGPIPVRYPVTELTGAGYLQRTRQNVVDSDGTLIVFFGELSRGTLETLRFCERLGKPFLLADCAAADVHAIAANAAAFIQAQAIAVLNVAGPRESSRPGAGEYAMRIVRSLIASRPQLE